MWSQVSFKGVFTDRFAVSGFATFHDALWEAFECTTFHFTLGFSTTKLKAVAIKTKTLCP